MIGPFTFFGMSGSLNDRGAISAGETFNVHSRQDDKSIVKRQGCFAQKTPLGNKSREASPLQGHFSDSRVASR
jgi:hypothetical protein